MKNSLPIFNVKCIVNSIKMKTAILAFLLAPLLAFGGVTTGPSTVTPAQLASAGVVTNNSSPHFSGQTTFSLSTNSSLGNFTVLAAQPRGAITFGSASIFSDFIYYTNVYYVVGCTNTAYNGRYNLQFSTNDVNIGKYSVFTNLNGLTSYWLSGDSIFYIDDSVLTTNGNAVPVADPGFVLNPVFTGHNAVIGYGYGTSAWANQGGIVQTNMFSSLGTNYAYFKFDLGTFSESITAVGISFETQPIKDTLFGLIPIGFNYSITNTGASIPSFNGNYTGNGSALTNLNASQLTSGTSKTPVTVTVGASPFTFTNLTASPLECYFSGGTAYSVSKNGVAVYGSLAGDSYFVLWPTNRCIITYTVAPTMFTNALW